MRRISVGIVVFAAVAAMSLSSFADEYFVDAVNGSDIWDGTSSVYVSGVVGPKKTLQAAVDLIKDDGGHVVTALPGHYDQGGAVYADGYTVTNRVCIKRNNVRIRSLRGKEVTHIVGACDPDAANGCGSASVRCVKGVAFGRNVVVEGFTLRNGHTGNVSQNNEDRGGGASDVTLYDCTISNCVANARGGGADSSRLIRCRVIANTAGSSSWGMACNFCHLSNCLVAGNYGGVTLSYPGILVNTTVVGNVGGTPMAAVNEMSGTKVYNCVFAGNDDGLNGYASIDRAGSSACYATVSEHVGSFGMADTYSVTNAPVGQCVSSAFRDGRLVDGSLAIGRGKAEYLDNLELPEGYLHKDIDGNELPKNGAINSGCFQVSVKPTGAMVDFGRYFSWNNGEINKWATHHFTDLTQVLKVAPDLRVGRRLYCVYGAEGVNTMRIPLYDGCVRIFANPDPSVTMELKVRLAEDVVYVDAINGNDDYDGTSATCVSGTAGPKKTLVAAANAVSSDYSLVFVAPGVYSEGVFASSDVASRLGNGDKIIGFVSSGGRGAATIVGGKQTRCAYLTGKGSFVQGFILADGSSTEDTTDSHRGAAYYSAYAANQLLDCIVSNCTAKSAVVYQGTMLRCKVLDCVALGGPLVYLTTCANSVFAGNTHVGSGGNRTHFYDRSIAVGCTIDAGTYQVWHETVNAAIGNAVIGNSERVPRNMLFNVDEADPLFASRIRRDFRLGCMSPAIGLVDPTAFAVSNVCNYLTADVDGNPFRVDNGLLMAGAVHAEPLPCVVVSATGGGGLSVENGIVGTNVVTEVGKTIRLVSDRSRPFVGFAVDGAFATAEETYDVPAIGDRPSMTVSAVYTNVWHVSQSKGDDGNGGADWTRAKKTIRSAAELAIAGDTVLVAAGAYGEADGSMLQDSAIVGGTPTLQSRVWVKDGVCVRSEDGPENTFIVGRRATQPLDAYGNGVDAIRCVVLSANASIEGFTLTGGAAGYVNDAVYEDDFLSGAVLGLSNGTSLVKECIISNNVACCAAAGYRCRFIRTRIIGNTATVRASAGRECAYIGCVIDGNIGPNLCEHFYAFDSCTIGTNNYSLDGVGRPNALQYPRNNVKIVNSVILHPGKIVESDDAVFVYTATNTVYMKGCGLEEGAAHLAGCIFTSAEACAIDDGYRPIVGKSILIDNGVSELSCADANEAMDATGFQRVMNGVRDIGALEGDWRPVYGWDIAHSRRLSVITASSDVYEDVETKLVRIPSDATLTCRWNFPKAPCVFRVRVVGGGTLAVLRDGNVVGSATGADGDKNLLITPSAGEIALSYSGDGYCELLRAMNGTGLVITFQ